MTALRPRRLWLVRHAAPLIAPGHCYGALDIAADVDATRHAAQALAQALPTQARLWHSPLQRCEQLAKETLRLRPDLTSKPDPRLREMDFGAWEGRPWNHIAKSEIDAWTERFADHAPGGGESLRAMLERVNEALQATRAETSASSEGRQENGNGDCVWITHAGVARCVQWLLQQHPRTGPVPLPSAAQWPLAAPAFGQWTFVELA